MYVRRRSPGADGPFEALIGADRWRLAWRTVAANLGVAVFAALSAVAVVQLGALFYDGPLVAAGRAPLAQLIAFHLFELFGQIPFLAFAAFVTHVALIHPERVDVRPPMRGRVVAYVQLGLLFAVLQFFAVVVFETRLAPAASEAELETRAALVGAAQLVSAAPLLFFLTMFPAIMDEGDASFGRAWTRGGFGRLLARLLAAGLVFVASALALSLLVGLVASAVAAEPTDGVLSVALSVSSALILALAVYFAAVIAVTVAQHYAERETALRRRAG